MVSLNIYPYICFIYRQTYIKSCLFLTILLLPGLPGAILAQDLTIDQYNFINPGSDVSASGSMPCGGGDVGLNVWLEKGDLLFYFSRSNTFDENNTLLKLGRIRLRLRPDPLMKDHFWQTLVLRDGSIVIDGSTGKITAKIKI